MNNSKKILLIEDDNAIRNMVQTLFLSKDYQVETATDGEIGFDLAQKGGFDAIIVDLKMPKKDGLAFLEDLKKTPPPTPNGPVVVYSSAGYDYAKKEALRRGAAAYINKDDTAPQSLFDQIEALINQQ